MSAADERSAYEKKKPARCGLLLAYVKGKAYGFSLIPLISLVRLHHYLLSVEDVDVALHGIGDFAALQIVVDVRLLTLDP